MSDYLYHRTRQYFGQFASGLERFAEDELRALGAEDIKPGHLGCYFQADQPTVYSIVYRTRIFSRILAPLLVFDCHSEKYLYRTAGNIDWSDFLTLTKTFAVRANTSDSNIRNSQYAARILKDAIVDQFRDKTGKRPNVDTRRPDLVLNLHIHENKARISVDLGGGSLHKRGYRSTAVEAPMQETLAAAMLQLADWQGDRPLYDPFCGSGTILCEAFMRAARIPAAYLRDQFGFLRLPNFDATVWNQVKTKANATIVEATSPALSHDENNASVNLIAGSDVDAAAIQAVRTNRKALPGGSAIKVRRSDFRDLEGLKDTVIVTNPPYGIRLGDKESTAELLKEFGDFLKQRCTGSTAYVFFGDRTLVKKLGLKPDRKHPMKTGGLDGMVCRYEMY